MENNDKNINLTDEETINLFVVGIMHEKGVELGEEPYKQAIFIELRDKLLREIDRSLVAELPDDKLEEFSRIVATDGKIDPDVVAKAVVDAGLDVNEITGATMAKFREIYLGDGADEGAEVKSDENKEA